MLCIAVLAFSRFGNAMDGGRGASPSYSAATLEGLVTEWVNLRARIAGEKRAWQEQEARMLEEIKLLNAEKAVLRDRISRAEMSEASFHEEHGKLLAAKTRMKEDLEALSRLLDRAEKEIGKWETFVPAPLAAPLKDGFRQIATAHGEARKPAVSRRLQVIIALYSQLEAIQHNVHLVKEIFPTGGGIREEADVLYLGLARAFAVSSDNRWAAVGEPGEDGWKWETNRALAKHVREAISVFNMKRAAGLVELPLKTARFTER